MQAVLVRDNKGPAENLYIGEVPKPALESGQVLVKVKAFGLNRLDLLQREGKYPPPPGASPILGVEFAGVISELGPNTTKWTIGDEVMGLAGGGAYAEYIAIPQTHVMNKPSHLSWVEAASIPEVFLTGDIVLDSHCGPVDSPVAFQALFLLADLKPGEDLLVHAGASGVGVAAAQLARTFGARHVIATTSTQEKIDWLKNINNGPTVVANYKIQDFAVVVKEVTNNRGVDVVVDFVGQSHWNQNLDALALDGRMVMLGLLSGADVASANIGFILRKRLRIQGSTLRSRSAEYQADLIRHERALHLITAQTGNGTVRTYIHKVYPWTEIHAAHKEMEANNNSGKIVVEIV
ncbi:hypothetical protein AMATHDRAFT_826 [Amanita thiersii Skay4041]|uniref:Enoyl reductase (ER) domain-containing protein n=1 Tax=Amanita thiersii Skay4041 TaxID=703135 RepID=A0A2A9P0I1_9AGAR|nr:hypothetical protein AMATHDRAFT_826 [Amanita thiersii Skay4041]